MDHRPIRQKPPSSRDSASASTLIDSVSDTLSIFSRPTTALSSFPDTIGASTPVLVYFLALVAAGFGIPMSEDVLCVFCGTLLPLSKVGSSTRRIRLILALYAGVVLSDLITFSLGHLMRTGLLEPWRKKMGLKKTICAIPTDNIAIHQRSRKRDRTLQRLEKSGNWTGFVVRLSPGLRREYQQMLHQILHPMLFIFFKCFLLAGMMLLAGFSGKISFTNYLLGTVAGATISLTAQLLLGLLMRQNPVATIVSKVSRMIIFVSATSLLLFWIWQQQNTKDGINV
jgi:membrane protein DedA with SNARE-associated domain